MHRTEISPSALRAERKYTREMWVKYAAARRVALEACAAWRVAGRAGRLTLEREDRLCEAADARRWAWIYQTRLEAAELLPVTAHGGRVSPNALERLRANGRLRT